LDEGVKKEKLVQGKKGKREEEVEGVRQRKRKGRWR
jgi:hypothetical protein